MFVGMFAPYDLRPRLFAAAWFGVAAFGAWVILLALVDCVATWLHFGDDRRIHKAEQLALRYKMDQFQKDAIRKHEESTQSDESSERSEE